MSDLKRRKDELLIALKVVEALNGTAPRRVGGPVLSPDEKRTLALELLGVGAEHGRTPKLVHRGFMERGITSVNPDNIRTILWRMGQRGEIGASRGRYWKLPAANETGPPAVDGPEPALSAQTEGRP